jgi:DNA sulfur modification protein DndC
MKQKIKYIIDEIIDQYLYADETSRPWIIGFSGGKDSTVLLQLVWEALRIIKNDISVLRREVYVVCNDTMIENPIITEYVQRVLKDIDVAARDQDLPIYVRKTTPRLEDSFFVNLIGRGYPAPNSTFRSVHYPQILLQCNRISLGSGINSFSKVAETL